MKKLTSGQAVALFVLVVLASTAVSQYLSFVDFLTLYNIGYQEGYYMEDGVLKGFFAEYYPAWDGDKVSITIGRGALGSTPADEVRNILTDMRYDFKEFMSSNDIIAGESKCEVKITIYDNSGSGIPYDTYPVDRSVPLMGKIVATDTINSDEYFSMRPSGGGEPYLYYHDYDCVLDQHYPVEELQGDYQYLLELELIPVAAEDPPEEPPSELPAIPPTEPPSVPPAAPPNKLDLFLQTYKLQLTIMALLAVIIFVYLLQGLV